ncbi:MAG: alpha/beta fold hydrolase [Actinomycetales bacterium]|nr:alpha/beta fold hydrolase [Actinomycetales bacterium]
MRLAVHEFGEGDRTAAIVHGISGSGILWQDFAERLARRHRFRVLAVDLRGHGDSARAAHYRLRDFAADLLETLPPGLDLALGHSLGGRVLADAAASLAPRRAVYLDPAFDVDAGVAGRRLLAYRLTAPILARLLSLVDPAVPAPLRRRLRASTRRWDRGMALSVVRELDARRIPPAAPPVPSTVVRATRSNLLRPGYLAGLAEHGWDVREFRARHDLHLLAPEALLDALDDVLRAPLVVGARSGLGAR